MRYKMCSPHFEQADDHKDRVKILEFAENYINTRSGL